MNIKNQLENLQVETILSSLNDGVFVLDDEQKIIYVNNEAALILDQSLSNLHNKKISEVIAQPVHAELDIEKIFASKEELKFKQQDVLISSSGKILTCKIKIIPVKGVDNRSGNLVILRDVSREKAIEDAKDNFLSIAAHQLRTPLGSSRWTLEMILDGDMGKITPEIKESIDLLYETNQRLISLVNDLLDISRIDQKRVKEEPTDTDVIKLFRDTLKELEPQIKMRAIEVKFIISDLAMPTVFLDPKRLREVVENLLSNAIKYNKQNGEITLKIVKRADQFEIYITDTGRGIPQTDQKMIFSKFFRAKNASLSETEGSGLGLFVVKSYIEGWGGQVSFESTEGSGTTFKFTIPFKAKQHSLDQNLQFMPLMS